MRLPRYWSRRGVVLALTNVAEGSTELCVTAHLVEMEKLGLVQKTGTKYPWYYLTDAGRKYMRRGCRDFGVVPPARD